MINPTEADIGRAVIYRPPHFHDRQERGIIVGFNDAVVFVRYGADPGAKATSRDDLEWETVIAASAGSSAGSGTM